MIDFLSIRLSILFSQPLMSFDVTLDIELYTNTTYGQKANNKNLHRSEWIYDIIIYFPAVDK